MKRTITPLMEHYYLNPPVNIRIAICEDHVIRDEIIIGDKPLIIDLDGNLLFVGEGRKRFTRRLRRWRKSVARRRSR